MNLPLLNPFLRYARYYPKFEVQKTPIICYDCRIFYLKTGSGILSIDKKDYEITADTFIFLPMGTRYRFFFGEDVEMLFITLDLTGDFSHNKKPISFTTDESFDKSKVFPYSLPEEFSKPCICNSPALYEPIRKCVDEYLNGSPYYREISSAYLKQCLIEYLREKEFETEYKTANKVITYIRKNYSDANLSNTDIAAYFDYHPYYLSNLVKDATGMSLRHYVIYYRIRIAKNFLTTTNFDIGKIAALSGFGSARYFNKIFKEHTGVTPKEYRKSHIFI